MTEIEQAASTPSPSISAIILAGGESRRLGQDKASLVIEGQPLLVRTLETVSQLAEDLIVVTGDVVRYRHLAPGARLIPDERPGQGSLMGVYSGLRVARHPQALVVACDLPFLSLPLLRYMVSLSPGADVVVPRIGQLMEPLHAIYSQACLAPMQEQLDAGRRRVVDFYHQVRVRYVGAGEVERLDPSHRSFINVNTPADWQRVLDILAGDPHRLPPASEGE
jgi:molybdopterin-guanine dinucleotide biosynthesis protein A